MFHKNNNEEVASSLHLAVTSINCMTLLVTVNIAIAVCIHPPRPTETTTIYVGVCWCWRFDVAGELQVGCGLRGVLCFEVDAWGWIPKIEIGETGGQAWGSFCGVQLSTFRIQRFRVLKG